MDYYVLSFEIVLLLLMFGYVDSQVNKVHSFIVSMLPLGFRLGIQVKAYGLRDFFGDFWNNYDLLNFGVMFLCVAMRGYWIRIVYTLQLGDVKDNEFVNLYDISQFILLENGFSSVNSLLIYLRAFKFFALNNRFRTFKMVWQRAALDLWAFWCLLFITLFSYTSAMYVAFSLRVSTFSTFSDSFLMIIQYMVGAYNLEEMQAADGFLGTFYVLTFMLQVYFCLMNIPMIILGDSYSWAYHQKPRKELMWHVRKEIHEFLKENISYLRKAEEKKTSG